MIFTILCFTKNNIFPVEGKTKKKYYRLGWKTIETRKFC